MDRTSELVPALNARLRAVETQRSTLSQQISQLETMARVLNEEQAQLEALLRTYGSTPERVASSPAPSASEAVEGDANKPVKSTTQDSGNGSMSSSWSEAGADILRAEGRPVHY